MRLVDLDDIINETGSWIEQIKAIRDLAIDHNRHLTSNYALGELYAIDQMLNLMQARVLDTVVAYFNGEPAVVEVGVTHCKDCKHYEEELFPNGTFKRHTCRNPYMGLSEIAELDPEDFCSYAERG